MQTASFTSGNRLSREPPGSRLRIAVLYSDQAAANKMTQVYGRLVQQLRDITRAEGMWWSMDLLKREDVFANSLHTASNADLLFVACNVHEKLPATVRNWLRMALLNSGRTDRAVAALLGMNSSENCWQSGVDEFLKMLTGEAGVEYYALWHQAEPPQSLLPGGFIPPGAGKSRSIFTDQFYSIQPEYSGGIND